MIHIAGDQLAAERAKLQEAGQVLVGRTVGGERPAAAGRGHVPNAYIRRCVRGQVAQGKRGVDAAIVHVGNADDERVGPGHVEPMTETLHAGVATVADRGDVAQYLHGLAIDLHEGKVVIRQVVRGGELPVEAYRLASGAGGDRQGDCRALGGCAHCANGGGCAFNGAGNGPLGDGEIISPGNHQGQSVAAACAGCVGGDEGHLQRQRLVLGEVLIGRIAGIQRPAAIGVQAEAGRCGGVQAEIQRVARIDIRCGELAGYQTCVFAGFGLSGLGNRVIVHRGDVDGHGGDVGGEGAVSDGVAEVRRAIEVGMGGEGNGAIDIEHRSTAVAAGDTGDAQVGAVQVTVIAQQVGSRVGDGGVFGGHQAVVRGDRRVVIQVGFDQRDGHHGDVAGCIKRFYRVAVLNRPLLEIVDSRLDARLGQGNATLGVDLEIVIGTGIAAGGGEPEGGHADGVLGVDAANQGAAGLVFAIGELLSGRNRWRVGIHRVLSGCLRRAGIAGGIGVADGGADLRVVRQVASADIDGVAERTVGQLDDFTGVDAAAQVQGDGIADGDFTADLASDGKHIAAALGGIEGVVLGDRVDGNRQVRRLGIQHKADGGGTRSIARYVGLAHGHGVATLDRGEGRAPGIAAIDAVLDGRTGFEAANIQGAVVGNAVGRVGAVGAQDHARCGDLRVEHEADRGRAGRIAGHVGLAHGHGVAALDRGEGRTPGIAAIDAVLDGRAGFGAADGQCTGVGDVVRIACTAVGLQGNARCGNLGVEHKADGGGAGRIAGHVGLAHGDGVASLDRGKCRGPVVSAVSAVLNSGAGFDATDGQRAGIGDAVRAACAAVD